MTAARSAPAWRRYLRFWRGDVQRDVDDEVRFHLESRIEDLVAGGRTDADARAIAVAEFGDVGQVRAGLTEIGRRAGHARARSERLRDLMSDISYSFRTLRRTPGVAIAILATLALGVGANAAMYSLLDAIFLRQPAGVVAPAGVHRIWSERRYRREGVVFSEIMAYRQFRAVADALRERALVTVYRPPHAERIGPVESTVRANVSYAPASYFSLLGVHAQIGRIYAGDEDDIARLPDVAVISDAYWRGELRGDSAVLGKQLSISGVQYTVVGVAARSFAGTELDVTDIWLPMGTFGRGRTNSMPWWDDDNMNGQFILARPVPGANDREIEQRVQAALRAPGANWGGDSLTAARLGSLVAANGPGRKEQETQIAERLAGVAVIVLLIACANVTNLLLARAVRRRREIAVRLALGISRARLVRLLLAESTVLAVGAAIASILVAYWGGSLLRRLLLPDVHWAESPLDWTVVVFALGIALIAGLSAGMIPALQSASPQLTSALKNGGSAGFAHQGRLRTTLVVAQAALSVVLLVGALLFVRSLGNVRGLDLGWDSQRLLTIGARYDSRARSADTTFVARIRELREQVARVPGVERTALTNIEPMGGFSAMKWFTETDSSGSRGAFAPTVIAASRGYFAAVGVRLLRGSDFATPGEGGPPELIVSEAMANGLWPGRNAIGQCMRLGTRTSSCYRIRGVVSDSRTFGIVEDVPEPKFYFSLDNPPPEGAAFKGYNVVARVAPERIVEATAEIRTLLRQEFPGAIPRIVHLSEYLEPQYRPWRLGATLFTTFGVLSLLVAAIGMYSTVAYGVTQRLHEFGIRIALGATKIDVLRLVVAGGLRTVVVGIAVGIGLALAGGRLIASLLYGVGPRDAAVLAWVAALLLGVATIAALLPALRAARVDPTSALRAD